MGKRFIKIFKAIFKVSSSSDKAESFMKRYISTIVLVLFLFIIIMFSRFHTQSIYAKRIKIYKELNATEAIYTKHKRYIQDYTRKSNLLLEVKRRGLDIEQNDNPPIELD